MENLLLLFILLVVAVCVIFDIRTAKIPNVLTYPTMLLGLILLFIDDYMVALSRMILMLLIFAFGMLRIVGFGDLKLFMCIGVYTGGICLLAAVFIASVLLLSFQFVKDPRSTKQEIRNGIYSMISMDFVPITKRKTVFAPFILCGLIGGIVLCYVL